MQRRCSRRWANNCHRFGRCHTNVNTCLFSRKCCKRLRYCWIPVNPSWRHHTDIPWVICNIIVHCCYLLGPPPFLLRIMGMCVYEWVYQCFKLILLFCNTFILFILLSPFSKIHRIISLLLLLVSLFLLSLLMFYDWYLVTPNWQIFFSSLFFEHGNWRLPKLSKNQITSLHFSINLILRATKHKKTERKRNKTIRWNCVHLRIENTWVSKEIGKFWWIFG